MSLPMLTPTLFQTFTQLDQASAFLTELLQLLLHRFAFPVQGGTHFFVLSPGRFRFRLEEGAIFAGLFAQFYELLSALVEVSSQLFLLTFKGFAMLSQLSFLFGKIRLLRRHSCCLDAQSIAFGLKRRCIHWLILLRQTQRKMER